MFIGCYTRKVQRGGWLRFPKEWLPFIGDHRLVFIMPDPDKNKSLLLVMSESLETLAKIVVPIKVTADGRMQIPAPLLAYADIKDTVCFSGNLRTISLSASRR